MTAVDRLRAVLAEGFGETRLPADSYVLAALVGAESHTFVPERHQAALHNLASAVRALLREEADEGHVSRAVEAFAVLGVTIARTEASSC